ncbi:MAG: lytic murein transglycosylase B [Pseudomonadales bacterium]|nr:lytic murein transglycosylase B [Pseudomonadales bacterium]
MLHHVFCTLWGLWCSHVPHHTTDTSYLAYQEVQVLIDQAAGEGLYTRHELIDLFAHAQHQDDVLHAMQAPAESLDWGQYRNIFVTPERLHAGLKFWNQHADSLQRAEQIYGVPAPIILAILGVETHYGERQGRFRVIDSLSTLAFDYPPRARYFRGELLHFLELCHSQHLDPATTLGSYAGAMGYGQFMPSSWLTQAVDFDGDGRIDLIHNADDALGSIAHYLQTNGWKPGPVAEPARITGQNYDLHLDTRLQITSTLGQLSQQGIFATSPSLPDTTAASVLRLQGAHGGEFWIAYPNFYVITRYNHSSLYAMAVWQLSQALAAAHEHGPIAPKQ